MFYAKTQNVPRFKTAAVITAMVMALGAQSAYAGGFFGDIARGVGNAVGGSVGQAINNTANAGDEASRRLQQGNVGGAVQSVGQGVISIGQAPGHVIRDLGTATGNRDIGRVARTIASTVTINSDVLGTATIAAGNVMAGQDIRQAYAAPLAAAIRHAQAAHMRGARSIPESIQRALRGTIPDYVLRNARYTEGELEISIANAINRGKKVFGHDHAVTVGNLIVFSSVPSDDPDDEEALDWWAHELAHVWQYSRLGIEQFAVHYIHEYQAVERDAERVAERALERYAAQ